MYIQEMDPVVASKAEQQVNNFGRFIVQHMAILIGISSDSVYIVLIPIQGRNKMSPRLISIKNTNTRSREEFSLPTEHT